MVSENIHYSFSKKELKEIYYKLIDLFDEMNFCQDKLTAECSNLKLKNDQKGADLDETISYLEEGKDCVLSLIPYLDESYAEDYNKEDK